MGRNAQQSSISVRLPKSAPDMLDWKWLERVHQYGGRRYRLGVRFWSRGLCPYTRKGLAISSPGSCASDQWVAGAGTKAPPPRTLCGRLATPSLAATLLATPTLAALPEMHRKSSMTRRIRDPQIRRCLHDLCQASRQESGQLAGMLRRCGLGAPGSSMMRTICRAGARPIIGSPRADLRRENVLVAVLGCGRAGGIKNRPREPFRKRQANTRSPPATITTAGQPCNETHEHRGAGAVITYAR